MIGDTILNFEDHSGPAILNFGEVKDDKKVVIFYKDLSLEFAEYESMWVSFNKVFVTEEKEIKTARIALIDKSLDKVVKRFYGKAIPLGSSSYYSFEAVYKDYLGSMTTTEFLDKYTFRLEVHITDPNETKEANINELLKDLTFYLKRDRK